MAVLRSISSGPVHEYAREFIDSPFARGGGEGPSANTSVNIYYIKTKWERVIAL